MGATSYHGAIVLKYHKEEKVWQVHQVVGKGTKAKVLSFLFLIDALEQVKRLANMLVVEIPNGEKVE